MDTPPASAAPPPRRCPVRRWYEEELGWPTADGRPGEPVRLRTGLLFDVLELPADAGFAVLRRVPRTGPVALEGGVLRLLVAAGSTSELPGLLDWLEWRGVPLELTTLGVGGLMTAPRPPTAGRAEAEPERCRGWREAADGRAQPVWLRPPEPGCEVEATLPATTLGTGYPGGGGGGRAPDLVRLVSAAATECHRARLSRLAGQALAFS